MTTTSTPRSTHSGSVRRRSHRRLLGVTAVVAAVLVLTGCLNEQGQRSYDLVNEARRNAGVHELVNDVDLNARAQEWADTMAARGQISHSRLTIPQGSTRVSENVGVAASVDRVHELLMNSTGHRNNILDARMTKVGIGATIGGDGRVYIVQIFAN